MRPLRPKLAAGVMLTAWVCFLIDRWALPHGSLGLEIWLTAVGLVYAAVTILALAGWRIGASLMPWASALLMAWGLLALMGLSADNVSSRSWMWASLFAASTGSVTFLLCCFPLSHRPEWGLVAFLGVCAFLGFAAWFQMSQCRIDIHASWCDPRYEQEDRIVSTVESVVTPVRRGHLNGVLGPAFATFEFEQRPDPATAVVPRSATVVFTDDPDEVLWEFGGRDSECEGRTAVDGRDGAYELRFTADCR